MLQIPLKHKWSAGVLSFCVVATLYALTNHLVQPVEPRIFLTSIDDLIPFLPATIWIYFSFFLFLPLALHRTRTTLAIHRAVYTFLTVGIMSSLVFILLPSSFPREMFPVPENLDFMTSSIWNFIRAVDRPQNCLPSLHASVATLIVLNDAREKGSLDLPLNFWGVLLVLSTMTTKQHTFLDVLAGSSLALLVHFIFEMIAKHPKQHQQ